MHGRRTQSKAVVPGGPFDDRPCEEAIAIASAASVPPSHLLDHRCQEVVAEELARLSRRVPSLTDDHLDVVETSLRQIIDRLLPARGRADARPEELIALFDLETS